MKPASIIPQRIIQTARSRDLPPLARAAARNLQLLHPDWEYCFFDDADVVRFVQKEFPRYRSIFDSFPYNIQRFDFFRYLAVFRLGGYYFDLDVFLSESLHDLSPHRCVFPFEEITLNRYLREELGIDWEIGNYGFGSTPEHPFLAVVIENCVRAQRDHTWPEPMFRGIPRVFRGGFDVLNTTGPGLLTRTFAEHRVAAADVSVIFPDHMTDLCDTANWHRFGRYGIHLMEASWRTRGNLLWRKAALLWESRRRRQSLAASRALAQGRRLGAPQLA